MWRDAGASTEVLKWIEHGIRVEWEQHPPLPFRMKPYEWSSEENRWWPEEARRLIRIGAIEEVAKPGLFSSPAFAVPKKKAFRMVIDLTWLNTHVRKDTFRMETLRDLPFLLSRDDWMIAFDVKDAFYAIEIAESDRQYFEFTAAGTRYRMRALPMGYCRSPLICTRLLGVVMSYLRRANKVEPDRTIRGIAYIDDFLLLIKDADQVNEIRDTLRRFGVKVNEEKSSWTPTRVLEHLGLVVDLEQDRFYVPHQKLVKVEKWALAIIKRAATDRRWIGALELAQFAGTANAIAMAVPAARLFLRSMYNDIGNNWNRHVRLSYQTIRDLNWWKNLSNATPRGCRISRATTTATIHTDASMTGWGGVLNWKAAQQVVRGTFEEDVNVHIQQLEARAVRLVVEAFVNDLRDRDVRLFEDNQAVVFAVNHLTSRSSGIMDELRSLCRVLWRNNITLHAEYITSKDNALADQLSRHVTKADWALPQEIIDDLEIFNNLEVDYFATAENAKLARYWSEYPDERAEGCDAFTTTWSAPGLFHPPWFKLLRVLKKIELDKACGVLIVPRIPTAVWWPLFDRMAGRTIVFRRGTFPEQTFTLLAKAIGGGRNKCESTSQ